ncbi:DUF6046 domain-containing protein [Algivirga pacifica]|uniref:DUF6046 domain-containing protein n=1 Tax=Algivirga pacifica TaxID=1162670 RepID=A0ABP9D2U7_9BACT
MRFKVKEHNVASQIVADNKQPKVYNKPEVFVAPDPMKLTLEAVDGSSRFVFQETPVINARRRKHIVVTEVNEGESEVVEVISMKGWELSFRGRLVDGDTHQYPDDQVRALNDFFEYNKNIKAYNEKLTALGIVDILLVDMDIPSEAGFVDTQEFTITARSVREPELNLLEL